MNRDKQMINDIIEIFDEEYSKRNLITPHNTAEKMTEKGYRKASDVAREIFEEIDTLICQRMLMPDTDLIDGELITDITELKKKYTECE
jgi:hypothetical protein